MYLIIILLCTLISLMSLATICDSDAVLKSKKEDKENKIIEQESIRTHVATTFAKSDKVYISGKITDNPTYLEDFKRIETRLDRIGVQNINPAYIDLPSYCKPEDYMAVCLSLEARCNCIFMMSNFRTSTGANQELAFAKRHGLKIIYEEDLYGDFIVR